MAEQKTVKDSIRDVLGAIKSSNFLDLTAAQVVYHLDGEDIKAFCDYYNIYPTVTTHGNWRFALFHKKDTDEQLTAEDYNRMRAEFDDNEETAKVIEHQEQEEVKLKYESYGWLSPDGTYYPADWGEHTGKAAELVERLYGEKEHYRNFGHAGDYLCDRGWALLHNPSGGIARVTARGKGERLTKKQNEFLYDYYLERNLREFADYYAAQL